MGLDPRIPAFGISGALALVALFLGFTAWRSWTKAKGAPPWPLIIASALVFLLAAVVFVLALESASLSPVRLGLAALTTLLIGIATGLFIVVIVQISGVSLDRYTSKQFVNVTRFLAGACVIAVAALLIGVPAGWWSFGDAVGREQTLHDNFELTLIFLGLGLVMLTAWSNRAWANATDDESRIERRQRIASDYSFVFACAVGVAVLVTIGANAFAARLAQQQIDALRGSDNRVTRERVQDAVFKIGLLDERMAAINRAQEREARQRAGEGTSNLRVRANNTRIEFWSDVAMLTARTETHVGHALVLHPPGTSFEVQSASVLEAIHQALLSTEDTGGRQSLLDDLDRLTYLRQDVVGLTNAADGLTYAEQQWNEEIATLERAYTCEIRRLAWRIAETRTAEAQLGGDEPNGVGQETAADDASANCTRPARADEVEALTLIGAARPLARSGMSYWLARRAPVTLSIELVLVMGALGALMRAISPLLRRVVRTGANMNEEAPPEIAAAVPTGLIELGLQIVFGMATALALFVLLNVAIGASSLDQAATAPRGDELSPFAMAALGLLGGYAGLNVADWIGSLTEQLLHAPEEETVAEETNTQSSSGVG